MVVLQGGRSEGVERLRDREPSEITIFGDSLESTDRNLAVCRSGRSSSGIDVTSLLVRGGSRGFGCENWQVSSLADSWWSGRGVSLLPWTEDLVLRPMREVWAKCLGVPIHARCIGKILDLRLARRWRTPGAAMVVDEIEHRASEEDHSVPGPVVLSTSSDGDNAEGSFSKQDQLIEVACCVEAPGSSVFFDGVCPKEILNFNPAGLFVGMIFSEGAVLDFD
ncbi:hypothetical protein Dimus_017328 [Dionaea muscipula]